MIKQLLTNEALDMMWYRPENTNIDLGFASVNIGILWSISHHIQYLIRQYLYNINLCCILWHLQIRIPTLAVSSGTYKLEYQPLLYPVVTTN